jgi:hypothetical protein
MPAGPRLPRVIAFQNWPGIDVTFLLAAKLAKKLINAIELSFDQVMVVMTPSVARDSPSLCCNLSLACHAEALRRQLGRASLEIIHRQYDD